MAGQRMFPPTLTKVGDDPPQLRHVIACSSCPTIDSIGVGPKAGLPPSVLITKWRRRGWDVHDNGKHVCPACVDAQVQAKKDARREALNDKLVDKVQDAFGEFLAEKVRKDGAKAMVKQIQSQTTPPPARAPAAGIAALYQMLGESFDVVKGRYAEGYDDARLAELSGLSLAEVIRRREADFGIIAPVSLDLGKVKDDCDHMYIGALEVNALLVNLDKTTSALQAQLHAIVQLTDDLKEKARKNSGYVDRMLDRVKEAQAKS